jgi:hypothetical protein
MSTIHLQGCNRLLLGYTMHSHVHAHREFRIRADAQGMAGEPGSKAWVEEDSVRSVAPAMPQPMLSTQSGDVLGERRVQSESAFARRWPAAAP